MTKATVSHLKLLATLCGCISVSPSVHLQVKKVRDQAVMAILQILKNPAYAGAFVYGKTRSVRKDPTSAHTQEMRLPMEQWKIRINDIYPAYITWDTFEQIQQMLVENYAAYDRNKSRGVPRDGAALLHGMV